MFHKATCLFAAVLAFATPSVAQEDAVLIELFTSQGCSSCPPADRYLHKLAKRDDVIALALHVDYWDYIGWKDIFAKPEFSARQRAYARLGNRNMVYTPQMVINGSDHVVGNRPKDANDLIEQHKQRPRTIAIKADRQGETLAIRGSAKPDLHGDVLVHLVRYRPNSTVEITRGENAGRTISYANVVTDMKRVVEWDLSETLSVDVPIKGDLPAVIVVQRGESGFVEAASKVD